MTDVRYENQNTGKNKQVLIDMISDKNTECITLFASVGNNPVMIALAEYKLPGGILVNIIYDGADFLNAARKQRYWEVKQVLNAAENTQKVFYSQNRAPFTDTFSPDKAIKKLKKTINTEMLTSETRPLYFLMLSDISENDWNNK